MPWRTSSAPIRTRPRLERDSLLRGPTRPALSRAGGEWNAAGDWSAYQRMALGFLDLPMALEQPLTPTQLQPFVGTYQGVCTEGTVTCHVAREGGRLNVDGLPQV